MFRLQDRVPSPYIEQSRDFQLLARMLDTIFNGIRFNATMVGKIINTDSCPGELLPLLKTKLGFFTEKKFLDDELREILKAFPYLIRWKGSKKAIESATYLYLRAMKIHTESFVEIEDMDKEGNMSYTIRVHIMSTVIDTSILDEIFKYILPIGYRVEYVFYGKQKESKYGVPVDEVNLIYNLGDMTNAQLRSAKFDGDLDIASGTIPDRLVGGVDTGYIAGTAYDDGTKQGGQE